MDNDKIRLMIADDQILFLESLKTVIELLSSDIEIIATPKNGQEVLDCIAQGMIPDVILLDIHMPVIDGIDVAKHLAESNPDIKIVMLTAFVDDYWNVKKILKCNVVGYLLKDTPLEDRIEMGFKVKENNIIHIQRSIVDDMLDYDNKNNDGDEFPFTDLTSREAEVFNHIARGLTNEEIADKMCISLQTVKNYVSMIYQKTGIHKRVQLMAIGRKYLHS